MPDSTTHIDLTERFVEVDAARLLLVINRFSLQPTEDYKHLRCWPKQPILRVLAREYYLQKLDFLLRNPSYFAYEVVELHRMGIADASDGARVKEDVRKIMSEREPELRTDPFRRFWRGAYENIDDVKSWWYARDLVYTGSEARALPGGEATPITYFFLTQEGEDTALNLASKVEAAHWYDERIKLIHSYFKTISAAELKNLQYSHPPYRDAQLDETIPSLAQEQISNNFFSVFGEKLEAYK